MTDEDIVRTKGGKDVWMWTLTNSQALIDLMIALRLLMGERRRQRIDFILAHSGFVRFGDEE